MVSLPSSELSDSDGEQSQTGSKVVSKVGTVDTCKTGVSDTSNRAKFMRKGPKLLCEFKAPEKAQ